MRSWLGLVVVIGAVGIGWSQSAIPVPTYQLETSALENPTYLTVAAFSIPEAISGNLDVPVPEDLCVDVKEGIGRRLGEGKVALATRGNCSFLDKAKAAKKMGYAGVLVRNSVEAIYVGGGNKTFGATGLPKARECDYSCSSGEAYHLGLDYATAIRGVQCGTGLCASESLCVLTGKVRGDGAVQSCCAQDSPMLMGAPSPLDYGVFWAQIKDGAMLQKSVVGKKVALSQRPSPFPWASLLLMLLATVIVAIGAYRAVLRERVWLKKGVLGSDGNRMEESGEEEEEDEEETGREPPAQVLTLWQGLGLVFCAGVMLGLLYGLLALGVPIVWVVMAFFVIASVSSTAGLVVEPLVRKYFPMLAERGWDLRYIGFVSQADLIGLGVGVVVVGVFVGVRLQPWSFVLQDALGAVLCVAVMLAVRLPSLRVATAFGVIFLLYDVFMVFLTPLIFKGSSVMVAVATAGGPTQVDDPACYCRLHPDDLAVCGRGEMMPIVLIMPRFADWRGGVSLLGLGDVILPGFIAVFALRADLILARAPRFGPYFNAICIAYAVGVGVAMLAVALTGLGQPALLYLMPSTLLATSIVAWRRGELLILWNGFKHTPHARDREATEPPPPAHSDTQSLLSAHAEQSTDPELGTRIDDVRSRVE